MESLTGRWADRRPETLRLLRWLEPNPRLPQLARRQAEIVADAVDQALVHLGDGPELTTGLRKMLEAKDCLVRQAILDEEATHATIDGPRARRPADPPPV